MKRAFTLVEVMVVVAILAVLTAIVVPVVLSARESANETVCTGHLHQIQLAVSMYRSEQGCDGIYGTVEQMGLPQGLMGLPLKIWRCTDPWVFEPSKPGIYLQLYASPLQSPTLDDNWATYAKKEQDNSVIFVDPNHRNDPRSINSPYITKFTIAVRLNGQIFFQLRAGDIDDFRFWLPEEN